MSITKAPATALQTSTLDTLINIDTILHMNIDAVTFAKAIADDTRQEIMKHLCCVWLSVNDVVDKLEGKVNQPTVSHHLKKLEDANLVLVRQEGRQRFYTLNQEQFTVCCGLLVRSFAPNYAESVVKVDDIK
jgi:ArsR family transcriptional regulator, arsenate/arsenite/antimonite-responsive transcriptional repressor